MPNDQDLYLEASKSSALSIAFSTLAQTDVDGQSKFNPALCREVAKLIVCRTYSSAILELSHLIVGACDLSGPLRRYEYFFWDSGIAHPDVFRQYCRHSAEAHDPLNRLIVGSRSITIDYVDGPFVITYSRMPLLSALMEFLLTALGYAELDEIFQPLTQGRLKRRTVSEQANALSRLVYAYLRDHLPPAQSQRKFRTLLSYCDQDIQRIDDQMILNFWRDYAINDEKGLDFKTYDSVLDSFTRLLHALEGARDLQAITHSAPIGTDHDAGEINPDQLHQQIDHIDEKNNALLTLTSPPCDHVKFLTKIEQGHLARLAQMTDYSQRLALSILRSDTFRLCQTRLSQAVRRKATTQEFQDILDDPEISYDTQRLAYQSMIKQIEKILHASLHALLIAQSPTTLSILLQLEPEGDFSALKPLLIQSETDAENTVIPLRGLTVEGHLIVLLQKASAHNPLLQKRLEIAEQTYNRLSRQGFKEDIRNHPTLIPAFEQGCAALLELHQVLKKYVACLEQKNHDWADVFESDQCLFRQQFQKLYLPHGVTP